MSQCTLPPPYFTYPPWCNSTLTNTYTSSRDCDYEATKGRGWWLLRWSVHGDGHENRLHTHESRVTGDGLTYMRWYVFGGVDGTL